MPSILVVDDEPSVRLVVRTTLETRQYKVRLAEDGRGALAQVAAERPDLIVLDWNLPDMSGLEVCRTLRATPTGAHIPVIFLTAVDDLARKLAGLETADDYVVKPFEPQELLARVRVQLRKAAERGQLNSLTNLPGNMLIEEAIRLRLQEPQMPFAILYFDLDDFKAYNDHYGFSWCNRVLQLQGEVIQQAVINWGTPGDFVGHIGGDDFVVISSAERAVLVAEGTIRLFAAGVQVLWDVQGYPREFTGVDRAGRRRHFGLPTLSIGIATNEYRHFDSILEIGQAAAQVKRAAKQQAGNGYFLDRRHDPVHAPPAPPLAEA